MTTLYFFTRRTPRTIQFIASSTEPKRYRKAGTTQVTLRWNSVIPREFHGAAQRVLREMKNATSRNSLVCGMELAATYCTFHDWKAEHRPQTGGQPEMIVLTRA